jgi:predicted TIM-barrel fold metal-dependent hydrolase
MSAPGDPALRLADYRPRSQLRLVRHDVPLPRHRVIDAHNHLGTPFGGDWAARPVDELVAVLDAAGVEAVVDLAGGTGDDLRREIERWQAPLAGRVAVFAGLSYGRWPDEPDFGAAEAVRLREGVAAGARGLKVWKTLGLHARDGLGRLVMVDDERLDPVWAAAGELGVPITIHIADPIAFFEPLDATNERWEELQVHPDWHVWPTRPVGRPDLPGFPPFDELIDGLEAVVARHPGTAFIGAHVGCAAEDLDRVERMLAAYPNWHVDIAARLAELGRQPRRARELLVRHPDRVLFGTDAPPEAAVYPVHYRFLETLDEAFAYDADDGAEGAEGAEGADDAGDVPSQGRWTISGLGLPDDVLRQVYRDNARRLISFD